LFVKKVGKTVVYLVVYGDDLLIIGNNEAYIASINNELKKGFEMKNMGHIHYYLGIEVTKNPKYIFMIYNLSWIFHWNNSSQHILNYYETLYFCILLP
jgi:hypothetical protein